ncbi:MAG TPA: sulfatase [Sphingobacteriaceae bacterium]|nr:sulfatase [Sphingobacteriaceae bacterium]
MNRSILIYTVFIVLICNTKVLAQKTLQVPNIVLIIGDDIGINDFGCYGNKSVKTPNIDRIAREGLRFTNFYLTASSCSPSRTSIISGRYPHNTGAAELHTSISPSVAIFPELLKNAGYYTAQSGKFHIGESARRGFHVLRDKGVELGEGGEGSWLKTLQERPKDKPFFMWLAAIDAHRPWRKNEFKGTNTSEGIMPPPYLANTEKTRMDMASYHDEISRFDHYIGLVENELKSQGVLNNTIIIIMSDNGSAFPRAKSRVYDSGMQTPFIIKWNNKIKKGKVTSSLVSAIDIAPTLLNLAGVSVPAGFQGKSFHRVLQNPSLQFRNYVFSEHNWHDYEAMERMVRTKDHLYVLNLRPALSNPGPADITSSPAFEDLKALRDSGKLSLPQADVFIAPRPAEELYDCQRDPMQLVNVSSSLLYAKQLKQLREVLKKWKMDTEDTYPENITKDWFNREDGTPLTNPGKRGEMPGGKNAITSLGKGPF